MVVQAITRLNIGGPARHVLDLDAGLRDRYSMIIAAGTAPEPEGELRGADAEIHRLPLVRSVAPHLDLVAVARVRRLLRSRRAAVVHSHMAKAGTVARIAAATLRPAPSTIHTFHGHVLSGYFSRPSEQVFTSIERQLARRTSLLLAVSGEIRDELLDLGIGTSSQYEVVPLGLHLDPHLAVTSPTGWLRRGLGIHPRTPLIGVLARLAPIKDHRTLLEAMALVPQAHLAVLGDGELRTELEALAERLGIDGRTHFLGWCTEVSRALADLDVVVLTSRNEGTPMSLIEAGAAGRPVVATDVGGVRRVVLDGRTGLLVPTADPGAVAAAVRSLLADPAMRARLGAEARTHVSAEFGLQPFLDRMAQIYDSLLQDTRRRSGVC